MGFVGVQHAFREAALPFRLAAGVVLLVAVAAVFGIYGLTLEAVQLAAFCIVLFVVSVCDIAERVIPDACVAVAALVRAAYVGFAVFTGALGPYDLAYYAASAVGLGAVLVALVLLSDSVFGGESMGGGDIKLYAVAAFYFGWESGLLVVMASCLVNVAVALASRFAAPRDSQEAPFLKRALPFAPAIALACIAAMIASGVGAVA